MLLCDISDHELLSRLKGGDSEACGEIYSRHEKMLRLRLAKRFKGNRNFIVREAVQRTFVLLLKHYDGVDNLVAWLVSTSWGEARHVLREERRYLRISMRSTKPGVFSRKRDSVNFSRNYETSQLLIEGDCEPPAAQTEVPDYRGACPQHEASRNEDVAWLRSELKNVAPEDVAVLSLVYAEGMSTREAALVLDVPYSFVKSSMRRAYSRLRSGIPSAAA